MRGLFFTLCFFIAAPMLGAQEGDAPPAAAPPQFSQVVGQFRLSSEAAPLEVTVEEPIVLKVRITGQASPQYQPDRKTLRVFPEDLEQSFFVEAVADQDKAMPERNTWEFVYRLRPKNAEVKVIPSLRLIYYAPGRRKFQTTFADEIPIKVKHAIEPAPPIENLKVMPLPDRFYDLYPAEHVLRDDTFVQVKPLYAVLLMLLIPFSCLAWLAIWKRRHPNAGEESRLNRSRAARFAVRTLEKRNVDIAATAYTLVNYLRERFDLPALDPTPAEIERHLRRLGAAKKTRQDWRRFFQVYDGIRYSPAFPSQNDFSTADALRLIHDLEADPCVSR